MISSGRVLFAIRYPYLAGVHLLRLSRNQFTSSSSWKFVGIFWTGARLQSIDNSAYLNRSSSGWHLGRQSIICDRHSSTIYDYDGRFVRQADILIILVDWYEKEVSAKNKQTLESPAIVSIRQLSLLPCLSAVNLNKLRKEGFYALVVVVSDGCFSSFPPSRSALLAEV